MRREGRTLSLVRIRYPLGTRDATWVELLAAVSEEFKTDKGTGPNTTRAAVETAYGKPTAITRWDAENARLIYDEIGLAFRLSGDVAESVIVFRPGTAKQVWRF